MVTHEMGFVGYIYSYIMGFVGYIFLIKGYVCKTYFNNFIRHIVRVAPTSESSSLWVFHIIVNYLMPNIRIS